jgi:dolichol-phosphate hexosyltransferase
MSPSPSPRGRVTLVLPAKNEQAAIGRTLRALPLPTLRALGLETEVFVLDGHSVDATAQISRRWGATVVTDRRPGKGHALRDALDQFRGDYVVMLDADGTYAPDAIPRILGPLLRNEADVVLGHRRRLPGSMTSFHFLGNKALSLFATVLYGQTCRDVCTGMWGFRREALEAMPLRSQRFGLEAELFSLASRLELRLVHVRCDYLPRRGPNNLSFGRDGLRIVRRLMRSRLVPLPRAGATARGRARAPETREVATEASSAREVRA